MKSRAEAVVVATLFGILFLATADNQLLIPLLPLLSETLQVSISRLGWLFSAYALVAALFSLLLAPLTDRLGRLWFLRLGLFLFALLAFATSRVESFSQLLALRGATGLAAGLLSTCIASLIGDFFPYERRGKVMGFVLSSYFAALILGVPLGAWIAQTWSWQSVFLASAFLGVVLLVVSLVLLPRESPRTAAPAPSYFRPYPVFLRRRETLAAGVVSFGVSGGTLAFLTFISGYLSDTFQLTPLRISSLFLIAGVASILASPVSGWLSDHWSKRGVFLATNTALVLPLVVLHRFSWGPSLIAIFFLISLCVAFRQTALHTVQTELVGAEQRGSFLALRNGFSQLGISISVFIAGNLYSAGGFAAVTQWAALLTLLSSFLFYWAVREPHGNRATE